MAQIAALLAAAMLLLAVLEGLAQGNAGLLARVVLVNLPLAFIATSVAYVVVQLLLVATDGLCHAIASASRRQQRAVLQGGDHRPRRSGRRRRAKKSAAAPAARSAQSPGRPRATIAVPLFVTFLAAIIGAFAAFFVWLELLMRDAAIYVVALFMPLALAASIWPRWSGALRRTGELLVVVIGSKFVIVSIISLAAGLVAENDGRVEHILAAAALMLLACFAPFVLLQAGALRRGRDGRRLRPPLSRGRRDERRPGRQRRADPPQHGPVELRRVGRDRSGTRAGRVAALPARSPGRRGGGRAGGLGGGGGAAGGGAGAAGGGRRRRQRRGRGRSGRSGGRRRPALAAAVPAAAMRGHQSRRPAPGRERASPSRRAARPAVARQRRAPSQGAPGRPAALGTDARRGEAPGAGSAPTEAAGGKAPRRRRAAAATGAGAGAAKA